MRKAGKQEQARGAMMTHQPISVNAALGAGAASIAAPTTRSVNDSRSKAIRNEVEIRPIRHQQTGTAS
jgi:hypothetical protein